jgi:hypothetical protein
MAYKIRLYRRLIDLNDAGPVELDAAQAVNRDLHTQKSLRMMHAMFFMMRAGLELRGLVCDAEGVDGGDDDPNARAA